MLEILGVEERAALDLWDCHVALGLLTREWWAPWGSSTVLRAFSGPLMRPLLIARS